MDSGRPALTLSPIEAAVAQGIADGLSNQAIADRLCFSHSYVRNTAHRLLGKLGCRSRHQVPECLAGLSGLKTIAVWERGSRWLAVIRG